MALKIVSALDPIEVESTPCSSSSASLARVSRRSATPWPTATAGLRQGCASREEPPRHAADRLVGRRGRTDPRRGAAPAVRPAGGRHRRPVPWTCSRPTSVSVTQAGALRWGADAAGFRVLKSDFTAWVRSVRAMRKGCSCWPTTRKEDKDGDVRVVRADVTGGSYGEIMKIADFVPFLRLGEEARPRLHADRPLARGRTRRLGRVRSAAHRQAGDFMATLRAGKAALGACREASAYVARRMFSGSSLETICDGDGLTRDRGRQAVRPRSKSASVQALQDRAKASASSGRRTSARLCAMSEGSW